MDTYSIYQFKLNKSDNRQGELFREEPFLVPKMEHAYQNFEHMFGPKNSEFRVQKAAKNGIGVDKYLCHVLAHDHNVILLRVENNKGVTIYEQQESKGKAPKIEKQKLPSYPPCYIIIDNRQDKAQLAVQINSAAWRNTDTVCALLQENINKQLDQFGLKIEIWSKMQKSNFWNYVNYRRKKEGRYIKKMTFGFPNINIHPSIEEKIGLSSHLKSLMNLIDRLGAGGGELSIQPPSGGALTKRKLADIKNMVALCASSDYSLCVTFDDNISYNCNETLRAELPMNYTSTVDEFQNGQMNNHNVYDIEEWLDWVTVQTEKYTDAEQIKPKPGGKGKQKVS